jgi:hypothetical protein
VTLLLLAVAPVVALLLLAVAPVVALLLLAVAPVVAAALCGLSWRCCSLWCVVVLLLAVAPVVALLLLAVALSWRYCCWLWPPSWHCCSSLWILLLLLLAVARHVAAHPPCGAEAIRTAPLLLVLLLPGRIVFHSLLLFVDATPPPPAFTVTKSHRRWQPL